MPYSKINKILTAVIIFLVILIVTGTTVAFILKKAEPGIGLRNTDPAPTEKELKSLNKNSDEKTAAYTGLGTIRACAAGKDDSDTPVAIVITPWLSYIQEDASFYEELSRKRLLITGIITSYFSERTKEKLITDGEEKIKADLMQNINSQLSLGQISNIYFTDYVFLE